MKRIIAVLLALALLMGLCACGGKSGDDTPAQSPAGDKDDSPAPSPTPEAGPGV